MQLTKHTDYAFRVLIYLAAMEEERTTIQLITETFNVSKTHLMKVVNELANEGWVDAVRGKNGGIRLAVKASEIILKDVLVRMEKTLEPINCETPMCHIKGVCQLKPILMRAQWEYLDYLARYTIEDLVNEQTIIRINDQGFGDS